MKIPEDIPVYGDLSYRSKICPTETMEQITFVARIKEQYQDTYGRIVIHPQNEGKLINGQFQALTKNRAMASINKGASDIIIPGNPTFVCEIKRRDHTLSKLEDEQIEYLLACKKVGCFVCVALGADAAMEAFNKWMN